ncbi:MAG: serine--tRNA ligase, partial [Nitrospina sp.]|nr:serine--tRNA ligase [Nitrospina sp.]
MLDQNLFINDYEETKRRLARKKVPGDQVEEIRKAIFDRKKFVGEVDGLRAEINEKSKQVGVFFQQGKKDEAENLKSAVPKLKEVLDVKEEELKKIDEKRTQLLLRVPNLPDDGCPDGFSEDCNIVLRVE